MIFIRIFCLFLLIGFSFGKKSPDGVCVTKLVKGKLVSVGDCKKDDGSEIAKLIKESLAKKQQNRCDVTHKKKCYRVVVYAVNNVTFSDAKVICKSMNYGKPANIYDLIHYKLLHPHLRSMIPSGWASAVIWTGMGYKNNQLLLFNGEHITIATEVWHPYYPQSDASYTNVVVQVQKDPGSIYQGISNSSPSPSFNGVICEI